MTTAPNQKFSVSNIWNELVAEERQQEARGYIRSSEMGREFLERYLKMKGVPSSNKFDARILRVFDCGHIFEEDIVMRIFKLLGLVVSTQDEVEIEIPGLLKVIGHHDPRLGGKVNVDRVKAMVEQYVTITTPALKDSDGKVLIPEKTEREPLVRDWMKNRVIKLAEKLAKQYPDGLEDIITEMKTVNSRAFWAHKNQDQQTRFFKGYPHHRLQIWGYLKGKNHPSGRLFYISKDDLTLMETPVFLDDKELEGLWMEDVQGMTDFWNDAKEMEKEFGGPREINGKWVLPDWLKQHIPEEIVYNDNKGKYELNWQLGWSNYLTLYTGFENSEEWQKGLKAKLKKMNLKECKDCKKEFSLTTLNKNDGYCGRCNKKRKAQDAKDN